MNQTPLKLFSNLNKETPLDTNKLWPPSQSISSTNQQFGSKSFKQNIVIEEEPKQSKYFQGYSRVNDQNIEYQAKQDREMVQYKQELELQYQDRIAQLTQMTQFRLETLWEQVQNTLKQVLEDELIETMKQDQTTHEFVWHRVVELFDEVFHGEREKLFEKVSDLYAQLKTDYQSQQRKIQQLEAKISQQESQIQAQVQQVQKEIEQQNSNDEFMKQQNENQIQMLRESVQKYKDLNTEIQQRMETIQKECLQLEQQNKSILRDKQQLTMKLEEAEQEMMRLEKEIKEIFDLARTPKQPLYLKKK